MRFFKQNSYCIVKLFINQIGMAIFGLMLTLATGMLDSTLKSNFTLLVSIFSILFYLYLIYTVIWDIGARDKIRIDAGRLNFDRFYGFKVAVFMQIPSLFFVLFLWGGGISLSAGGDFGNSFGGICYGIALPLSEFLNAMYLGVIMRFFSTDTYLVNALLFTLALFPAILVCGGGYLLGVRDIRFLTSPRKPKQK